MGKVPLPPLKERAPAGPHVVRGNARAQLRKLLALHLQDLTQQIDGF
jgi:hypothetical protein